MRLATSSGHCARSPMTTRAHARFAGQLALVRPGLSVPFVTRSQSCRVVLVRGGSSKFAGLSHASRYCGLLRASPEADRQARRLDPNIVTIVTHTYFAMGDY
jgi:hypothetical protein